MNEVIKELLKIFASWTKLKVKIHLSEREIYPKVKEIWWASLGQNIGVEINGKNDNFERPVLVIKVFNNQSILIAPISSSVKKGKYLIDFINDEGEKNIINMSQIRSVSGKRFIRNVSELSTEDFTKVKQMYQSFL